jgi:hypothetical protein
VLSGTARRQAPWTDGRSRRRDLRAGDYARVERQHHEEPVMAKASKKIMKKIDKLEKQADDLRKKAEKKGKDLQSMASDKIDDLGKDDDKGGKKGVFALLLAIGAGVAVALKRKRDQELDEALWEEPRSI